MSTKDLRSAIWRFCARIVLAGDPYELGIRTGPTNWAYKLGLQTRRQLRRGFDGSTERPSAARVELKMQLREPRYVLSDLI